MAYWLLGYHNKFYFLTFNIYAQAKYSAENVLQVMYFDFRTRMVT